VRWLRDLERMGILGINRRNADFTLRWNKRSLYPRVDDKLLSKRLCVEADIPVPRLLAVARRHFEIKQLPSQLANAADFVLKPARGAMGNGILVILGREGDRLLRPGGRTIEMGDVLYHAASIISGLYALGGHDDVAMVEERLKVHPVLREVATEGVPDIRVIVFRGIPVMAMTRLPTRRSDGRANLHQGAVGVGINIATGLTTHAILKNTPVRRHPDTKRPLLDLELPDFATTLEIAVRATDVTGLGYVGADVVVDATRGPVVLELNARPGLAVQLANRAGLEPRLLAVEQSWKPDMPVVERLALGRRLAVEHAPREDA